MTSQLHPTRTDYVGKARTAVQTSVNAGHLLPEDAAAIVAAARDSDTGRPRAEDRRIITGMASQVSQWRRAGGRG
ncbi:hypothetical protein ACE1SV_08580 [Streptomyces sp. E-15]